MKITVMVVLIAIAASTLIAGSPPEAAKSSPAFDKLKSLAGEWKGKNSEGQPFTVTYKLVSAGTSMMETLDMGDQKEAMVTMYHMDGKKVMMTHYCSMGNQPRMRAESSMKAGTKLTFSLVDVANLSGPKDNYMKKLVFNFKDGDHFSQEWTMRMGGTADHPDLFEFERVK
jgi:hypothetical protein